MLNPLYTAHVPCLHVCKQQYPPEWTRPPASEMMFFPTADACCKQMFDGNSCEIYTRGCDGPVPSFPNYPPSPSRPGGPPPGYGSSMKPTAKPLLFYVDDASGICLSNYEKPPPDWLKEVYRGYDACCQSSKVWQKDKCLQARPVIEGQTLSPTATPLPVYYEEGGTCVVTTTSNHKPPSYVTTTFDDYNRCCILASSNPEACIASFMDPIVSDGSPTGKPSIPPPLYYLVDSTSICVNQNDIPMPYEKETFLDYDQCCKQPKSWNQENCLAARPSEAPTTNPTVTPPTAWPTTTSTCPKSYDSSMQYKSGSEVEVNQVIYRCLPGTASIFCNQATFQPPADDPGPNYLESTTTELWQDAWERLAMCIKAPSSSPTLAPTTLAPTTTACNNASRWHATFNARICTNSNDYPMAWKFYPLSETYFADTKEECCSKFYDDVQCTVEDVCFPS